MHDTAIFEVMYTAKRRGGLYMKKCIIGIILVFTLVLGTGITAFAEFGAYAAPVFTLRNVMLYDYIEIKSVMDNSRIVLYSGPEVNESTVITSSSRGHIIYNVTYPGRYTLTWTDTWGGGWYWY